MHCICECTDRCGKAINESEKQKRQNYLRVFERGILLINIQLALWCFVIILGMVQHIDCDLKECVPLLLFKTRHAKDFFFASDTEKELLEHIL